MNMEMWLGLLRHLLTFGGGFIVARGYLDELTWVEVSGALVTLVGAIWSVIQKRQV